jgi:hypothetical protein
VTSSAAPISRKSTSAPTLMIENQNSISPNHFTATMFMAPTNASAMKAKIHCGTSVNVPQYFM